MKEKKDFGDILDRWNRSNDITDKDKQSSAETSTNAERRSRLRRKKPDAVIDIHGLTRDEAWEELQRFFDDARRQNMEKILVIHGKGIHSQGEAVLKRVMRDFIQTCPFAGESGQGKTGGSGVTWVLLK